MNYRNRIVSYATLICFICGAVAGLLWPDSSRKIEFIGTVFMNILKYLALPVLFVSILKSSFKSGVAAAGSVIRAVLLFVIMFVASFLICTLLYSIFSPGKYFSIIDVAAWSGNTASVSLSNILRNLFSIRNMTSINSLYFPSIIIAFLLGFILKALRVRTLGPILDKLESFLMKLLSLVMAFAPIGVFSLMAKMTGSLGIESLKVSGSYVIWAYSGSLVVFFFVMILPLRIVCGITPKCYFMKTGRLLLTAVSTCSSSATLPETMRTCIQGFQSSEKTTSIVTPLGCTIHMCGGAVSFCLLGLSALQMTGHSLSLGTLLTMLFISLLLNMGAPGIPGGGIVLGATYLAMLGLHNMELFLGMYAGIYRILDMAYTSLNVAGDVTANMLIDAWERKHEIIS